MLNTEKPCKDYNTHPLYMDTRETRPLIKPNVFVKVQGRRSIYNRTTAIW